MNGKCGVGDAVVIEQTFLDHQSCSGIPFFSRLECEDNSAVNPVSILGQHARGADEHRRVAIVSARMHRSVYFGSVIKAGCFLDF